MERAGKSLSGEGLRVSVDSGRVTDVRVQTASSGEELANASYLAPALVDIQVNGFAGFDVNGPQASPEQVVGMVRALWATGVGLVCPTVITNSREAILRSLQAVNRACEDPLIQASIPCVHLEGPYISPVDGPRGAHALGHVRPPDWNEFQAFQEAAGGRIGIVTLAPEAPGAIPFIERLAEAGVVVALGHTAADGPTIQAAIQAGARLSTHLGNGSHALLPRHPNYIWEQAAADELWASLIVDGHHLPPAVVKCLVRAKGLERSILTSDAVAVAGLPPGRYRALETEVEVSPDLRCSLVGTPYLAGSALELRIGVEKVMDFAGLDLEQAWRLASENPAALLGIQDRIGLVPQREANMVRFRLEQGRIVIEETVVAGQVVFCAS